MYVDFTYLNRTCPKDHYPLPSINKLINALAGYAICSLVDAISGYHQIIMDEPDDEKTTFITDERIFYYRVMPFGFKNTGATCQRLVNGLFKQHIRKTVEVYIDDMTIKSKKVEEHTQDIITTFDILDRTRIKLNPEK